MAVQTRSMRRSEQTAVPKWGAKKPRSRVIKPWGAKKPRSKRKASPQATSRSAKRQKTLENMPRVQQAKLSQRKANKATKKTRGQSLLNFARKEMNRMAIVPSGPVKNVSGNSYKNGSRNSLGHRTGAIHEKTPSELAKFVRKMSDKTNHHYGKAFGGITMCPTRQKDPILLRIAKERSLQNPYACLLRTHGHKLGMRQAYKTKKSMLRTMLPKPIPPTSYENIPPLHSLTLCELKAIARYHGLCRYSKATKSEMVRRIAPLYNKSPSNTSGFVYPSK